MPRDLLTLRKRFPIEADCMVWLAILGQVDLALRHPKNDGPMALIAERFSDELRDRLKIEGALSNEEYAASLREQIKYRKNPIPGAHL